MQTREFSLQPALSYKRRLEEVCQMELAEAEETYAREHRVLELLGELERIGYEELERQHKLGTLDLEAIDVSFGDLETLQKRIEQQLLVLRELSEKIRQKRERLIAVAKDKKALEKLKEKHERELALAVSKAEDMMLEDISTSQFNRQRNGAAERAVSALTPHVRERLR